MRQPISDAGRGRAVGATQPARNSEQAWFWSERWQRMEREADEDIKAGRVKGFDNVDALFADLESDD